MRVSDIQWVTSDAAAASAPTTAAGVLPPADVSALHVTVWLCERGEQVGQPSRTTWVPAHSRGSVWGEWLQLTVKVIT